jgi:hypothetical protein
MPAVGQHPVRQTQARPPPPAGQGACCFLGPRLGRLSGSARTRSYYLWLSHTRRTKPSNSVGGERLPQNEALAADYRAIDLRRKKVARLLFLPRRPFRLAPWAPMQPGC